MQEVGRNVHEPLTTQDGYRIFVRQSTPASLAVCFAVRSMLVHKIGRAQHHKRVSAGVVNGRGGVEKVESPLRTIDKIQAGTRRLIMLGGDLKVALDARSDAGAGTTLLTKTRNDPAREDTKGRQRR